MKTILLPTLALSLAAAGGLAAQGPAPGLRLYAPHGTTDTFLLDVNGTVVHTWPGDKTPGSGVYLEPDGTLLRSGQIPGGPNLGWEGGAIQRYGFDGQLLWDFDYTGPEYWTHHDIALLPNGNVLAIAWDRMTADEAIAAGRDPALLDRSQTDEWLPDAIVEIRQTGPTTGDVVWEWHQMDHVIQDHDPTKANFGVVADHPELLDINYPRTVLTNGEWNHLNSVTYDATTDLIVINSPLQEEFYFLDHSTTTAEAAGHTGGNYGRGGDFVYRWGNPEAYGRGTPSDKQLFFAHGSYIIPPGIPGAGNVLVFNNRAGLAVGQNYSSVVEIQLPATFDLPPAGQAWGPSGFVWQYTDPTPANFYSWIVSNAERLPNGNTLVCSGAQSWLFEVDPGGQMVWQSRPPVSPVRELIFQVSYYDRHLWADRESVSAAAGGDVSFGLVAGTTHALSSYAVLGSASGTGPGFSVGGVNVPLNPDGYMMGLIGALGTPGLASFAGSLDALGNGRASLTLPPLAPLAGLTLHHGFVVLRGTSAKLASNAVPLVFGR